tara:strand:+ start:856 stop:1242 length:387 start_codon:yes stop_codon:yes gene_type:complete
MESLITEGIQIIVNSSYEEEFSHQEISEYVFSYHIEIANENDFPVQLISRKWFVLDSKCEQYEVQGPGVIGEQPIIKQGANYEYESGTQLTSPIGRMSGYYIMKKVLTEEKFKVYIPAFDLIAPFILN